MPFIGSQAEINVNTIASQTSNSGKFLTTDGTNTSWSTISQVPSQSGHNGKFLTTDGSSTSWSAVDALPSQSSHSGKFLTTDGTTASWSTVDALPSQSSHSGKYLTTDGSSASWATISTDLVSDTSPQLGGSLDVNSQSIVSTSNGNIDLDPNGSGKVVFKGNATKGSGQFVLNCENNSHGITLKGPPHSAGASYTLTLPDDDGTANQFLQTDGSGNLTWATSSSNSVTGALTVTDEIVHKIQDGIGQVANSFTGTHEVSSGYNAVLAGPITLGSSATLTVSGNLTIV